MSLPGEGDTLKLTRRHRAQKGPEGPFARGLPHPDYLKDTNRLATFRDPFSGSASGLDVCIALGPYASSWRSGLPLNPYRRRGRRHVLAQAAPLFHHAGFVRASCFSHEKWCWADRRNNGRVASPTKAQRRAPGRTSRMIDRAEAAAQT